MPSEEIDFKEPSKKNIPIKVENIKVENIKVEKKKERTNKKLYEEILWLTGC